ncbi:MAG: TetR/AcrR family transcriptional repressor of nem operon [Gammaproteobacteria bacterium]|jgi:TetR/AcrR family transcriptional repressor of nem operon
MPRTSDKRERLIDAANALIHRHGFHKTTLADIADESNVPLGNVYYYFKTKEEICDAVIEERKKELTTALDGCCKSPGPKKALLRLLKTMIEASDEIAEIGCPHGRLCTELSNEIVGLTNSADDCLKVILEWSRDQFKALGYKNAKDMSFEFVSRIQGIVLLGNALHDGKQVKTQLKSVCDWVESLKDLNKDAQVAA